MEEAFGMMQHQQSPGSGQQLAVPCTELDVIKKMRIGSPEIQTTVISTDLCVTGGSSGELTTEPSERVLTACISSASCLYTALNHS